MFQNSHCSTVFAPKDFLALFSVAVNKTSTLTDSVHRLAVPNYKELQEISELKSEYVHSNGKKLREQTLCRLDAARPSVTPSSDITPAVCLSVCLSVIISPPNPFLDAITDSPAETARGTSR